MKKVIDLTQEIYNGMPVFPGHMQTHIWNWATHEKTAKQMEGGFSYQTKSLLLCDHGPTHVDAINHVDPSPDALSVDEMSLETFFGPAICLDMSFVKEHSLIRPSMIQQAEKESGLSIQENDIVLFYTGHYDKYYPSMKYLEGYSGFSIEAGEYLIKEKRIKNWGVDTPSPDRPPTKCFPLHVQMREYPIPHMENLCNLDKLFKKRFMFYGFPLKIRGGSGSPIRAVAVTEE